MSSKGQVTIPLHVRKKLKLHKGSVIYFTLRDGSAVVKVKPAFSDSYGKFRGLADGNDPAEELRLWRARSK